MSRLLFLIIMAICVVAFGVVWYTHRSNVLSLTSGAVVVHDGQSDKPKTDLATPGTGASGPPSPGENLQVPAKGARPAQIDGALVTPPSADTNTRNPPNGMIFAGRGKYQLYRQGDITWRLNTDTGQACILFATDAEWSQPRVYQQGCGAK
jgi:hypothetical protein